MSKRAEALIALAMAAVPVRTEDERGRPRTLCRDQNLFRDHLLICARFLFMRIFMKPLAKTPRGARVDDLCDFQEELASAPIDQAVPILEELADHPDPSFRSCALDVLEKIAPERATALAFRFLDDPEGGLRFNALNFLAEHGNRDLMPLSVRLLASDPDECVRSFAAFCLGRIGDPSAIPVLRMAVEHDTGEDHEGTPIRETAQKSLQIIEDRMSGKGGPNDIPSLNFIRVDPNSAEQGR